MIYMPEHWDLNVKMVKKKKIKYVLTIIIVTKKKGKRILNLVSKYRYEIRSYTTDKSVNSPYLL